MEMTPKEAYEALRANEQRIKLVIENMPVGLLIFSPEGTIESVNPYCEWMLGLRAEGLAQSPLAKFFDTNGNTSTAVAKIIEHCHRKVGNCTMLRNNGEPFPAALSVTKMETSEGIRYLMSITDETERSEIQFQSPPRQ
ncbi:MAG TPA: PAS domain-containing protein [Chroococcales cyanobacterium]